MADGMHQVRFAHADATVQEERIVGARGTLSDGQGSGTSKLVAIAYDEVVKGVARVELRGGGPVEASLLWCTLRGRWRRCGRVSSDRAEASIFALRWNGGILFGGHEAHVIELERLQIDGFLNEVAVLVANVLKLR